MKGSVSLSKAIFVYLLASVTKVIAFSTTRTALKPASAQATAAISPLFSTNTENDNESTKHKNALMSREDLFQNMVKSSTTAATATFITFLSSPNPANADVTNKIASQASLRYIKRSIKEFEKLEFFASMNDYSEMKQGLRSPALSEIRKNAKVLIKGGEDGVEAENLVASYDDFIKDIEKLDSDASLGFRGRKGVELYPSYEKAVKDLKAFSEVAERSTLIPIASTTTAN